MLIKKKKKRKTWQTYNNLNEHLIVLEKALDTETKRDLTLFTYHTCQVASVIM